MSYPWKQLHPKDAYAVRRMSLLSNVDQQVLTLLYQPLIGRDAYSLYMTWWADTDEMGKGMTEALLSDVLSVQNIGIPEFYNARIRLEGLGLLKTYVKREPHRYVYELYAPLSPEAFFSEPIFELLLLNQLGEARVKRLKAQFLLPTWDQTEYEDITSVFTDVYHFQAKDGVSVSGSISSNGQVDHEKYDMIQTKQADGTIEFRNATFDWTFFSANLSNQFVKRTSVMENRNVVEMLHYLYGIDELEMSKYALEASDPITGDIQADKLKMIVHRKYQKTPLLKRVEPRSEPERPASAPEQTAHYLSKQDAQLLQASEKRNPADFLLSIKNQKGGFITQVEQWTLEDIVSRSGLTAPVVNILIHYILVVKGNAVFDRNLSYKIANDWAQSGVKTPQQAMDKVRTLYEEKDARTQRSDTKRRPSYGRSKTAVVRKESLPDWAKEQTATNKPTDRPISEAEQSAFKERLKKIRGYTKEGET